MSTRTLRDEEGIALVTALLAVVILAGLATLFAATAVFETRSTTSEQRFETAMHAAEASTDDIILNVTKDLSYHTTYDGATNDHVYLEHNGTTYTDEEAWARDVAADTDSSLMTTTGFGEAVGIRPLHPSTSEPMDLLFGIGYLPNRAAVLADQKLARSRVTKLQIQPEDFAPNHALLSNGDLTLGGSAETQGVSGDVHANGDVYIAGNGDCSDTAKWCVDGDLTMTGQLLDESGTPLTDAQVDSKVRPGVTGNIEEDAAPQHTPPFRASDLYDPSEPLNSFFDPNTGATVEGRWWVLCPPGYGGITQASVRKPDPGGVNTTPKQVCLNEPAHWKDGDTANFHGWDWNTSCGEFGNNPCWVGDKVVSGAFYMYKANAVTNGGRGAVTMFTSVGAEGDEEPGGLTAGNIHMKGQPLFRPGLPDLISVAERDIIVNGRSGTDIEGIFLAHEQFKNEGTGDIRGSMVGHDQSLTETNASGDPVRSTPNSPVDRSSTKGSFTINYDLKLRIPVPGIVQITAWNEL